jgi:hypothetical protein
VTWEPTARSYRMNRGSAAQVGPEPPTPRDPFFRLIALRCETFIVGETAEDASKKR